MEASFKAQPLSRKFIRNLAKQVRLLCDIKDNQEFPVIKFMEFLLSKFDYTYHICQKEELQSEYAKTIPAKKIMMIREDVYERAVSGVPRDIFTIAHEIGHAVLHDIDTIALARNDEKIKAYENPEWQANTFAAELIAPSDIVKNLSIDEIVNIYNCSYQVAEIQLQNSNK